MFLFLIAVLLDFPSMYFSCDLLIDRKYNSYKTRAMDRMLWWREARFVMFAVGNHLPPNIPKGMMDRYIEYLKEVL